MDRRNFLKVGAAGLAGIGVGLARPARAVIEPDPCVPGLSYISGDVAGTVPHGETWHVVGDVNLTGDLVVEGTLTGVDTFTLEGNGFQILVQHGGRVDLAGVPKSGWVRWGDPVVGWSVGDRLAVAPSAKNFYGLVLSEWAGDWALTVRPSTSPDVPLPDGTVARPEVVNLDQTIRLRNLSRIMLHGDIGTQRLTNVAVVDSGVEDVTDFYPIHFHLCGESSRGSVLRDVVVENGKHHSFVPHESHGIEFVGCAAVNGFDDSFWWNPGDHTNDVLYDRCAVVRQSRGVDSPGNRKAGFRLANGSNNRAINCAAAGVSGTSHSAGFLWPENGGTGWSFADGVAHNNGGTGVIHYTYRGDVDGAVCYRNHRGGVSQLTYRHQANLRGLVISENQGNYGLIANGVADAEGAGRFDGVVCDQPMKIGFSPSTVKHFTEMTGVTIPKVIVEASLIRWRIHGLTPAVFDIRVINPESIIELVNAGTVTHRWTQGAWT